MIEKLELPTGEMIDKQAQLPAVSRDEARRLLNERLPDIISSEVQGNIEVTVHDVDRKTRLTRASFSINLKGARERIEEKMKDVISGGI